MKTLRLILSHVIALIFVINVNSQVPLTINDFDGNTYEVIDLTDGLDTLYFTKTSMKAEHYSDGTPIDATYWGRATTPENNLFYKYAYSAFVGMAGLTDGHSNPAKVTDFTEFSNMQGPCPDGWRIPTQSEWEMIIERGGGLESLNMTSAVDGNSSASESFTPPDFINGSGWTGYATAAENAEDYTKAIHLEYGPQNPSPSFQNWSSKATNAENAWGFLSVRCIRTSSFKNNTGISKELKMKIISGDKGAYKIEGLNSQRTTLTIVDIMGRNIYSKLYDIAEPIEFSLPVAKQIYLVNLYNQNGKVLFSTKLLKIDE